MVFVETEASAVIKPAEVLVSDALDEIGRALEAIGIDLEELLGRGRERRGEMIEKEYGLDDRPTSFGKV